MSFSGKVLRVLLVLPAAVFVLIGLGWFLAPTWVSSHLGMSLLSGVGLSTQIGDLGSFFFTTGTCMLLGLRSGHPFWFYPPLMLIGTAAFGRVAAWLFHDAAFATTMLAVEIPVVVLLLVAIANQTKRAPPRAR